MKLIDFFRKKTPRKNIDKIKGIPFGYKNSWFAFKTENFNDVRSILLKYFRFVKIDTLENGLKSGWNGDWCLLRPINGFILFISSEGGDFREQAKSISEKLGEIHFYSTHRSSNYMVCTKFINGKTHRDFSISDGEINLNIGNPTEIELIVANREKQLSIERSKHNASLLDYKIERDPLTFLGDENNLMEISGNWSLNPALLNEVEVENECEVFKLKK